MSKTNWNTLWALVAVVAIAALCALTGCVEEQQVQQSPIWGKGDLPPQWTEYFGKDNGSRMDFRQSQIIDELAKRVRTLEVNQYSPEVDKGKSDNSNPCPFGLDEEKCKAAPPHEHQEK